MNSILALDLGLSLGWALDKQGVSYGEVAFHSAHRPMRWVHFADWLADRLASYAPELVVYERVVGVHRNGAHARLAHGFAAYCEGICARHEVTVIEGASPMQLKKFWCGTGRASKEEMLAQARRRGYRPSSHDAADALALLHWTIEYVERVPA